MSIETMEQRLLEDAEQELLAQLGTPPNRAELAVLYRKIDNGTYRRPEWEKPSHNQTVH